MIIKVLKSNSKCIRNITDDGRNYDNANNDDEINDEINRTRNIERREKDNIHTGYSMMQYGEICNIQMGI